MTKRDVSASGDEKRDHLGQSDQGKYENGTRTTITEATSSELKRKSPIDDRDDIPASLTPEQQAQQLQALVAAAALQNSYSSMAASPQLSGDPSVLARLMAAGLHPHLPQSTDMPPAGFPPVPAAIDTNFLAALQQQQHSMLAAAAAASTASDGSDEKGEGSSSGSVSEASSFGSSNGATTAAGLQMATLSYMLQQQQLLQLESMRLGGGVLNPMVGLPPMLPGYLDVGDESSQKMLKKMRFSPLGADVKRKARSNSHTKSFHCSLCSKRFSLKEELEEHMHSHTSDEMGNETYMQKSFACTECSFRTKYKFCLQRHMHIHSGEKPLVCPYCRYRSISKVSYDNHIRTHTGDKPFACPYCSYKSSFKNNLTKHIKTHTGDNKPYTCTKCSSCFTSQMQLKAHMKLHLDPSSSHSCPQCLYSAMSRFELECHMRTHVVV